jgi:hypothetical protein
LYGRGLVVIVAEQYASRLVVPASQRSHPTRWSSHKDHAAKALRKLAGPHLPASLAELERAIKRAHRDYSAAERGALETAARERTTVGAAAAQDVDDEQAVEVDETEAGEDTDAEEDLEAGLDA